MVSLSIKGPANVAKILAAVSNDEVQVLITLDDFQANKVDPEAKYYTVEIVDPRSGDYFEKVEGE